MKSISSLQIFHLITLINCISVFTTAKERTRGNLRRNKPSSSINIYDRQNRPGQGQSQNDTVPLFQKTILEEIERKQIKEKENIFLQSRIIGGTNTQKDRYKYIVSLMKSNGFHVCGGSLIANNLVLTAAHCDGHFDSVQIGRYNLSDDHEMTETFKVSQKIVHEYYDSKLLRNDIMLLQLDKQSSFPTIMLDKGKTSHENLSVVGWGVIDPQDDVFEGKLQEASLGLIPNDQCQSSEGYIDGTYASYYGLVTDSMICAHRKGKDACYGDSGGPLIRKDPKWDRDILVGIVSWAFGCAHAEFPGVYTRIESYDEWINSHACALSDDTNRFTCRQRRGSDHCPTRCQHGFHCSDGVCVNKNTRTKGDRNKGN